jgi:hypothetical protein
MKMSYNSRSILFLVIIQIITLQGLFGQSSDFDTNAISLKIKEDHNWMMLASVNSLSENERQYLQPELEQLVVIYTLFPDFNWGNYGEWGDWSGYPNSERTPNLRREWGISYACGYDPVSKEGIPLSLHGMREQDGYEQAITIKTLFPRIVDLFKQGQHGNATRVIGAISHGIQDAATFPDFQALHRSSTFKWCNEIGIKGYNPIKLGETPDEAVNTIIERIRQMTKFVYKHVHDIRRAMKDNNWEQDKKLRVECANEAAKLVADLIHTSIILAGEKIPNINPFNINLVVNGDCEQGDFGEPSPKGWVAYWNDPKDRIGILDWEGRVERNQNLWRSGGRSLKMMWASKDGLEWRQTWDVAPIVQSGEYYKATAWAKTVDASGRNILVIEFYSANTDLISSKESPSIIGNTEWSKLEVQAQVPSGAVRMRVILRSLSNEGAVWFDDIELIRIKPGLSSNEPVSKPKPEVLMFQLSFEEGKGVAAIDSSIFKNGPNVLISDDAPFDLHTSDGYIGSALKFDGVDDFVECPAHRDIDVQCPKDAMTLSLWLYANDYRDAVIVCKEQYPLGEKTKGYRLELCKNGKLRFSIHTELGKVFCESSNSIPKRKWVQIIAIRTKDNMLKIYNDGEAGKIIHASGAFRPAAFSSSSDAPSHLYIGSDTGLNNFLSGKIDEFKLYNEVLENK